MEFDVEDVTWVGCDGDMLQMNIGSALRRSKQLRNLNIGALRGYEPSPVRRMFTMDSIADTVATIRGLHCLKLSVTNDGVWRNRRPRARWVHLSFENSDIEAKDINWDWFCSKEASEIEGLVISGNIGIMAFPNDDFSEVNKRYLEIRMNKHQYAGFQNNFIDGLSKLAVAFDDVRMTLKTKFNEDTMEAYELKGYFSFVSKCIYGLYSNYGRTVTFDLSIPDPGCLWMVQTEAKQIAWLLTIYINAMIARNQSLINDREWNSARLIVCVPVEWETR